MTAKQKGLAFKRIEDLNELLVRALAAAGHRVYPGCCSVTRGAVQTEDACEAHGVVRRIVEGA